MTLREVTMYRVECDHDGCAVSAQDGSDYHAWLQDFAAIEAATDAGWYVGVRGHYCPGHAPPEDEELAASFFEWALDGDES